jgi:hypothetical protein
MKSHRTLEINSTDESGFKAEREWHIVMRIKIMHHVRIAWLSPSRQEIAAAERRAVKSGNHQNAIIDAVNAKLS